MRDRDAQQHRAARSALTPEEQASQRKQNTLLRQELRHERTAEEIDEERNVTDGSIPINVRLLPFAVLIRKAAKA
jgi:hypothetical protein